MRPPTIDRYGRLTRWGIGPSSATTATATSPKVRSKANTGTQTHAIGHDIITTYEYDRYGNRTKTTFMPGTTQEKVVETVYDPTHNTYPVAVKTTVTVDGVARIIRTRSEWDVNRGLKTADIDPQGRRTEYVYWKDRRLKYTRDVAANLYTVPTYDKDGTGDPNPGPSKSLSDRDLGRANEDGV